MEEAEGIEGVSVAANKAAPFARAAYTYAGHSVWTQAICYNLGTNSLADRMAQEAQVRTLYRPLGIYRGRRCKSFDFLLQRPNEDRC